MSSQKLLADNYPGFPVVEVDSDLDNSSHKDINNFLHKFKHSTGLPFQICSREDFKIDSGHSLMTQHYPSNSSINLNTHDINYTKSIYSDSISEQIEFSASNNVLPEQTLMMNKGLCCNNNRCLTQSNFGLTNTSHFDKNRSPIDSQGTLSLSTLFGNRFRENFHSSDIFSSELINLKQCRQLAYPDTLTSLTNPSEIELFCCDSLSCWKSYVPPSLPIESYLSSICKESDYDTQIYGGRRLSTMSLNQACEILSKFLVREALLIWDYKIENNWSQRTFNKTGNLKTSSDIQWIDLISSLSDISSLD